MGPYRTSRFTRTLSTSLIAVASVFLSLAAATSSQAAYGGNGCPFLRPDASYGFIGFGTELPTNPFGEPAGPIATLLIATPAGPGALTVKSIHFANGVLIPIPSVPGTYAVSDDCEVFDVISVPGSDGALTLTGYGVIVDRGAESDYMAPTPGDVVQNYVGRQLPAHCSDRSLSGTFGVTGSGVELPTNPLGHPGGPVTTTALYYFDGRGQVTQEVKDFINGTLFSSGPLSGMYAVHGDCTIDMAFPVSPDVTLMALGVVLDEGERFHLLPTTPGGVVEALTGKRIKE